MVARYFAQKIDTPEEPNRSAEGEVLETKEITREQYEKIKDDRDAIERGFDGKWDEAFMILIQSIESIRKDYRRDAKRTSDTDIERELLNRKIVAERILLEAERIKENTEGR